MLLLWRRVRTQTLKQIQTSKSHNSFWPRIWKRFGNKVNFTKHKTNMQCPATWHDRSIHKLLLIFFKSHYKQTSRSESNLSCWVTYSSSEYFGGFIFTWRIDRYAISGRNTWWCATVYGVKRKRFFLLTVSIYHRFRRKAQWCCSKFKAWVTLRKR